MRHAWRKLLLRAALMHDSKRPARSERADPAARKLRKRRTKLMSTLA
jgi:hypothetical protein